MDKRLAAVRQVALDLDGTIYSGRPVFKTALLFLVRLAELGERLTGLMN